MRFLPAPLKDGFLRFMDPVAASLIRWRIRPNVITTIGFFVLVAAAVAFGTGGGWMQLGAALLLLAGVLDIIDGKVARGRGMVTSFGAFYDSMLDRVGEAAVFMGIATYFIRSVPSPVSEWGALCAVIALLSSMMVSYARARAEGLGLDCKVGMVQRAERILVLAGPTLFVGAGPGGKVLLAVVAILAIMSTVTVVQRVLHVCHTAPGGAPSRVARRTQARPRRSAVFDHSHKGS